MIKCPYCNFEEDESFFPEYFSDTEDTKIRHDLDDYGIHIVCCEMCGKAIVIEDFSKE